MPLAAVKVYLKGSNKFESWEEIQFTKCFFFIGCLFSRWSNQMKAWCKCPKIQIFGCKHYRKMKFLVVIHGRCIFQKQATPFFSYNYSSQRIKFRKLAFFFNFHKARAREKCLLINQSYLYNPPNWHELKKQEKCSSLAAYRSINELQINLDWCQFSPPKKFGYFRYLLR